MSTTILATNPERVRAAELDLIRYLDLKLAALGEPTSSVDVGFLEMAGPVVAKPFSEGRAPRLAALPG